MDEEPATTEEPSSLRDAIESAVGQEEVVDQPVQEEVQHEVSDSFESEAVEIEPDEQPELELNAEPAPKEAIRPGPKSEPKYSKPSKIHLLLVNTRKP